MYKTIVKSLKLFQYYSKVFSNVFFVFYSFIIKDVGIRPWYGYSRFDGNQNLYKRARMDPKSYRILLGVGRTTFYSIECFISPFRAVLTGLRPIEVLIDSVLSASGHAAHRRCIGNYRTRVIEIQSKPIGHVYFYNDNKLHRVFSSENNVLKRMQ